MPYLTARKRKAYRDMGAGRSLCHHIRYIILNKLLDQAPQIISGSKDNKIEVIEQADLIRIYASSGKILAVTHKGEYALRLRLYEIEERLPRNQFVRISNSEIINLKKVNNFDLIL